MKKKETVDELIDWFMNTLTNILPLLEMLKMTIQQYKCSEVFVQTSIVFSDRTLTYVKCEADMFNALSAQ